MTLDIIKTNYHDEAETRFREMLKHDRPSSLMEEDITKVLKSLEFHDRAVEFWQLFGKACAHAVTTERTQRLRGMAAAEEDLKILRADGTITIAKSFVEAWEEISVKQGQIIGSVEGTSSTI